MENWLKFVILFLFMGFSVLIIIFGPESERTLEYNLKMRCIEQKEMNEFCKGLLGNGNNWGTNNTE